MPPRRANTLGAVPAVLGASGALRAGLPGLALDCCRVHYVAVVPVMVADVASSGSLSALHELQVVPTQDHAPNVNEWLIVVVEHGEGVTEPDWFTDSPPDEKPSGTNLFCLGNTVRSQAAPIRRIAVNVAPVHDSRIRTATLTRTVVGDPG
jgi:hypothetical protein